MTAIASDDGGLIASAGKGTVPDHSLSSRAAADAKWLRTWVRSLMRYEVSDGASVMVVLG